jgi:hypothetical protein
MPYLDLSDLDTAITLGINDAHNIIQGMDDMAIAFVQMVRGNMEGFMECKVKNARAACKAQAMLGHPTNRKLDGTSQYDI